MQADYELNPYRRRGGEERAPNPAASVVSDFDIAELDKLKLDPAEERAF